LDVARLSGQICSTKQLQKLRRRAALQDACRRDARRNPSKSHRMTKYTANLTHHASREPDTLSRAEAERRA